MFCKNCGKKLGNAKKFCTNCGTAFSDPSPQSQPFTKKGIKIDKGKIIGTLVIVTIIGLGIYGSRSDTAIKANNDALSNFNSGNGQQAINQFQDAVNNSTNNATKITTLKNLAYAQATEGQNDQALATFQEALPLTSHGSLDYYLISGEIAVLKAKPSSAYFNFNQAHQIDPNDFQVNNSLAIFYLNLDSSAPDYQDYPKALVYAQKAYNISNQEIALENLGIAYYINDDYDQAASTLSQVNLSQHPHIGLWLGLAYAGKNDVANAKYYLQGAINAGIKVPQQVYDYLSSH